MKITELTQPQIAKFQSYIEKWVNIGLSTESFSKETAETIIHNLQKNLGREETPVFIFDSPIESYYACLIIQTNLNKIKGNAVAGQVGDQVWGQVAGQVRDQVRDQVRNQVRDQVLDQVRNQVWGQVRNQVRDQVLDQVAGQVGGQVWGQVKNFIWPYLNGQFDSNIFSYYDFFLSEGLVTINEDLKQKYFAWQETSKLGIIYMMEDFVVICKKPTIIKKNNLGLHSENGPALAYGEKFKIWALNGVVVPEYLVKTRSGDLNLDFYNNEKNADVRTEFVRKFGVERMLEKGKLIDSYSNKIYKDKEWYQKSGYELWDMNCLFKGVSYAPHLKMVNQTTGVYHVEAVSPNCRTIADALKERFCGNEFEIAAIA